MLNIRIRSACTKIWKKRVAWAASYVNPYADLLAPTAYRSWDSDRRLAENEADGI